MLCLFQIYYAKPKLDINNSIRIIFIKIMVIFKVNFIKIYNKNTIFISKKCDLTKIFIKKSKSSLASKASWNFSIILLLTDQSGINLNAARQSSKASSHIFWILNLSGQYINIKRSSETTLSHVPWVSYQSGTESNTKKIY